VDFFISSACAHEHSWHSVSKMNSKVFFSGIFQSCTYKHARAYKLAKMFLMGIYKQYELFASFRLQKLEMLSDMYHTRVSQVRIVKILTRDILFKNWVRVHHFPVIELMVPNSNSILFNSSFKHIWSIVNRLQISLSVNRLFIFFTFSNIFPFKLIKNN
jgi:hypothetical protein